MKIEYTCIPTHYQTDPTMAPEPHWLLSVVEGMRALVKDNSDPRPIRVKPITYTSGYSRTTAWVIKNSRNKMRVILRGEGEIIYSYVSLPTPPKPNSPHLPQYPDEKDSRVEKAVWMMKSDQIPKLAKACADWMEQETYYSDPEYERIKVSTTAEGGFLYGRILSSARIVKRSQPYWKIEIESNDSFKTKSTLEIKLPAIRFADVVNNYLLVYKSEDEAEILSDGELAAFYQVVV